MVMKMFSNKFAQLSNVDLGDRENEQNKKY